jgi:hypothetical protein
MNPMETKNSASGVRKAIVLSYGKQLDWLVSPFARFRRNS